LAQVVRVKVRLKRRESRQALSVNILTDRTEQPAQDITWMKEESMRRIINPRGAAFKLLLRKMSPRPSQAEITAFLC
jgi:hypothetical protein